MQSLSSRLAEYLPVAQLTQVDSAVCPVAADALPAVQPTQLVVPVDVW